MLFAPYLGDADAIEEIRHHGGIRGWVETFDGKPDIDQQPWFWIDAFLTPGKYKHPIILAYGKQDRIAAPAGQLAAQLPENQVFTNAGEHKWIYWTPL